MAALARRHRTRMPLTKLWLCCLLLHIPQWIASVFYLLYMHLPLLSPFSSRSILKWQLRECIVAIASALLLVLPHPHLSILSELLSQKKKKKKKKSRRLSLPPHISLLRFLSRCWAGQSGPSYCQPRQDKIQPNSLGLGFMKTYEDMGSECKNSAQRKRCFNPYVNRETDYTDFFFFFAVAAAGYWTYMWNH